MVLMAREGSVGGVRGSSAEKSCWSIGGAGASLANALQAEMAIAKKPGMTWERFMSSLPLPVLRERAGVRVHFASITERRPHPNPLPEYRERGKDFPASRQPRRRRRHYKEPRRRASIRGIASACRSLLRRRGVRRGDGRGRGRDFLLELFVLPLQGVDLRLRGGGLGGGFG